MEQGFRRPAVVVGAGPAGLATALALRANGVPTTLLEAGSAKRLRPGSRAVYIHRTSLQILEDIRPGLGSLLAAAGVVWRGKRTFYKGREVYRKIYAEPITGALPPFASLAQSQTERILTDECLAAGVEFEWDTSVTCVEITERTAILHTCQGQELEADFVVAADGPRSAIRQALGMKMSGSRSSDAFVVVDLEDDPEHPLPPERRFHYQHPLLGERNLLMLPFAGGWRLDLQCHERDCATAFSSGSGLRDWISKVVPSGHSQRVAWVTTYTYMHGVAEHLTDVNHRVLLVGEAAHVFSPYGARGLNSGIADAQAAGEAISAALGTPDRRDQRAIIGSYDRRRRLAAEANRRASSAGLAMIQGRGLAERARRQVAAKLALLGHQASGKWLDAAPYGPRLAATARSSY